MRSSHRRCLAQCRPRSHTVWLLRHPTWDCLRRREQTAAVHRLTSRNRPALCRPRHRATTTTRSSTTATSARRTSNVRISCRGERSFPSPSLISLTSSEFAPWARSADRTDKGSDRHIIWHSTTVIAEHCVGECFYAERHSCDSRW